MGLAPYFDKTALAAAAVLRGFDRESFADTLERHVVGIVFDESAVRSSEGRVSLELLTNLTARLYPRIRLAGHGRGSKTFTKKLGALAVGVNPKVELVESDRDVTVAAAVGDTTFTTQVPKIYIGSNGWIAGVSARGPVGSAHSDLPFGPAAAACFAAANLFRFVFAEFLVDPRPDELWMSVLDLDPISKEPANPSLNGGISIGESHLVGVGAIGNAVMWTLSRTKSLRGILHVIDGEDVDSTNPQRYVLTETADVDAPKVDLAVRERNRMRSAIDVRPHAVTWGRYLAGLESPWALDRVAVALDSAKDRIAVQAALPRRVLNAWTQAGDLGVSRHELVGPAACLACLYLPSGPTKNEDQIVAEAIGLPREVRTVRELLYNGAPVGEELIRLIATANSRPVEPLLPFATRPIRALYVEAVCGGLLLRIGNNQQGAGGTDVPMAFQSALAGVLLAATLVADAAGFASPNSTKTVIDLLRPLGEYLGIPVAKHPSGRCICQDADFQASYRNRHGL